MLFLFNLDSMHCISGFDILDEDCFLPPFTKTTHAEPLSTCSLKQSYGTYFSSYLKKTTYY